MRIAALMVLSGTGLMNAQTPPPAFEVASIKPNQSLSSNSSSNTTRGLVSMQNQSLKRLIQRAYNVGDYSYSGPAWLESVSFDLVAKPPAGATKEQFLPMMQALLAERFKLPIRYVGIGEGADDLRPFEADAFARGLMGLD